MIIPIKKPALESRLKLLQLLLLTKGVFDCITSSTFSIHALQHLLAMECSHL